MITWEEKETELDCQKLEKIANTARVFTACHTHTPSFNLRHKVWNGYQEHDLEEEKGTEKGPSAQIHTARKWQGWDGIPGASCLRGLPEV